MNERWNWFDQYYQEYKPLLMSVAKTLLKRLNLANYLAEDIVQMA